MSTNRDPHRRRPRVAPRRAAGPAGTTRALSAGRLPPPASVTAEPLERRVLFAAGALDPSFGTNGGLRYDAGVRGALELLDAVTQPDGKVVVLLTDSDFTTAAVVRFNANGSVDTAFNGGAAVRGSGLGRLTSPVAVAVQSDGKVVLADGLNGSVAVVRLLANGTLDDGFGTSGVATINSQTDTAFDVADVVVRPDDRIVVGGSANGGNNTDFALFGLGKDGGNDSSFNGGTPFVTTDIDDSDDIAALALLADGRVAASGVAFNNPSESSALAVALYRADGTPDPSFDGDGRLTTARLSTAAAGHLAVQGGNKIVLFDPTTASAARLNANGTFDTSFAGDGVAAGLNLGPIGTRFGGAVAVEPTGRVVVAYDETRAGGDAARLIRLNADGTVDPTFNDPGALASSGFAGLSDRLLVGPNNTLVVASSTLSNDLVLFRFDASHAPTAAASDPVATPAANTIAVTVTFTGETPIDPASVAPANVRLTGPNNYSAVATGVGGVTASGNTLSARYTFPPPGGRIDAPDAGTYQLAAEPNGVKDAGGNAVPAGAIGTFAVDPAGTTPDLAFTTTTFTAGTYAPGASIPANLVPAVTGGTVPTFGLQVVLSTDNVAGNANDVAILSSTAATAGTPVTSLGPIPASTPAGQYFLIARLDPAAAVAESSETNNTFVSAANAITVAVPVAQPDLAFADTTFAAGTYAPGASIPANLVPAVAGGAAPAFGLQVVLSTDATAGDADDVVLLNSTTAAAGAAVTSLGPIPPSTPAGDYFLIARLDPQNAVAESNEANNQLLPATASITVAPPPPAVPSLAIGGLDTTFGFGGTIRPRLGFTGTVGVRQQPDEKLVIGGNRGDVGRRQIGFGRTSTNHTKDTSFGTADGVVFHDVRGTDNVLVDFELLADGKILAAGVSSEIVGGAVVGSDFFVARFNGDGSVDPTFGTGGRTIIDFAADATAARSADVLRDLLVLDGGRVVVVGRTDAGGGGTNFAAARLNADGSPDATFATGGKLTIDFAGGDDGVQAVAATPAGGIVAAGYATESGGRRMAVAQILADGSPDGRFGTGGRFTFAARGGDERANAVTVAANGTITLAGSAASGSAAAGTYDSDVVTARLTSRGRLDRKFGTAGIAVADFGQPATPSFVGTQTDGRVLISGVTTADIARGEVNRVDVALVRFTAAGALDPSFGGDGTVILLTSGNTTQAAEPDRAAATAGASGTNVPLAAAAAAAAGGDDPIRPLATAADNLDAFQNSVEGKLTNRVGGGALLAGTNGAETVIAALVTSGVELSGVLTAKVPAAVIGGAKGSAAVRVSNLGDVLASGPMEIKLFASADQELGSGDHSFLTVPGQALNLKPLSARGKPKTFKLKFTFPKDLPDGTYFLLADVNASRSIPELNPNNNAAFTDRPVTITAPFVDLTGPALAGGGSLSTAKPTTLRVTLQNGGNVVLKGTADLTLVLSPDATLDAGDTTLAPVPLKLNLKPQGTKAFAVKVNAAGVPAGDYFLFARIDPANVVAEKNEANNLLASALPTPVA